MQHIYAVGRVGFDFGSEARQDSFAMAMRLAGIFDASNVLAKVDTTLDPNDPLQLSHYLLGHPWAVEQITWTLTSERDVIYALEPDLAGRANWGPRVPSPAIDARANLLGGPPPAPMGPPVAMPALYSKFITALIGQADHASSPTYVSRISLAGSLTTRTARLLSGQIVPVVEVGAQGARPDISRSLKTYPFQPNVAILQQNSVANAVSDLFDNGEGATVSPRRQAVGSHKKPLALPTREAVDAVVPALFEKAYAALRNHGEAPGDRAMNYLGTELLHSPKKIALGLMSGWVVNDAASQDDPSPDETALYTLDTVSVSKSAVDRYDSDFWDVKLTFFNPRFSDRAKMCYVFTVDVSDELPVALPRFYWYLAGSRSQR